MQHHAASQLSANRPSTLDYYCLNLRTDTRRSLSIRPDRQNPCVVRSRYICAHAAPAADASGQTVAGRQAVSLPDLPATYKRLVARRCGASFRQVAAVQELPLQPPGPGEVLIRITHAGINGGCETFRARGEHAFAPNRGLQDFPLGAEGAGVVAALGPDVGGSLKVGQQVAVNGAAAFAEYVSARPSLVTPLPEGVGGGEGAALVLSGVTACVALEATARVRPGEVVVVTAAAGGTGHLALQLAAAAGATVVAVVGGGRKAEAVAALGAHLVINRRRQQDVGAELRRLFPAGVDVVYDGVGGELRNQLLGCLGPSGRLLQVGYISEYPHARGYRWKDGDSDGEGRGGGESSGGGGGGGGCSTPRAPTARGETRTAADAVGNAAAVTSVGAANATAAAAGKEATEAPTDVAAAAAAAEGERYVPSSAELFWGGLEVALGQQRRIIGQIWPKDLKATLRCRRRVFDLARNGQLRVLLDQGHGSRGVEGVADAVDYMLRGEHVGKVVIEM